MGLEVIIRVAFFAMWAGCLGAGIAACYWQFHKDAPGARRKSVIFTIIFLCCWVAIVAIGLFAVRLGIDPR